MKRTLLLLSALLAVILLLSGCFWSHADDTLKNEFFSEEYLTSLSVHDLPQPPLYDSRLDGESLYLNLTKEEFLTYSEKVGKYLAASPAIYHAGAFHSSRIFGLLLIPMRFDMYVPLEYGYEINESSNRFAYARGEELSYTNAVQHYLLYGAVTVSIVRKDGHHEDSDFDYNTVMTLSASERVCMEETAYYRYSMSKALARTYPDAKIVEYIGRYGDCTVARVSVPSLEVERETVADFTFEYSPDSYILVHYIDYFDYSDAIMTLTEVYEDGYLYEYNVEYIYEIYNDEK